MPADAMPGPPVDVGSEAPGLHVRTSSASVHQLYSFVTSCSFLTLPAIWRRGHRGSSGSSGAVGFGQPSF